MLSLCPFCECHKLKPATFSLTQGKEKRTRVPDWRLLIYCPSPPSRLRQLKKARKKVCAVRSAVDKQTNTCLIFPAVFNPFLHYYVDLLKHRDTFEDKARWAFQATLPSWAEWFCKVSLLADSANFNVNWSRSWIDLVSAWDSFFVTRRISTVVVLNFY